MTWVVLLLTAVVASALLTLVPFDLSVSLDRDRSFKARVRMRWLFFRLAKDLKRNGKPTSRKPKKKAQRRPGAFRTGRTLAILRVRGLGSSLRRLAARLCRSIRIHRIDGSVRIGMSDPADTGRVFSILAPTVLLLNRWRVAQFRVEPCFEGPELVFHMDGTIRVYPARVLQAFVLTIFSTTTLRVVTALLRNR